jgi:hypothetical protein
MRGSLIVPPCAKRGEGDHATHGGGVSRRRLLETLREPLRTYPSTTLRVVPLPIFNGEAG